MASFPGGVKVVVVLLRRKHLSSRHQCLQIALIHPLHNDNTPPTLLSRRNKKETLLNLKASKVTMIGRGTQLQVLHEAPHLQEAPVRLILHDLAQVILCVAVDVENV